MGKKLNTLTQEQAEKIWDGRPKLPEKKIKKFAHEEVFAKNQYFFKYKEYGHRYGHCTACGKDVQIDIENMRTYTQEHLICRYARHNDKVYFTELQQTAAKVQELIGKINAKDPATGTKLSAAVISVLQSTAEKLETKA